MITLEREDYLKTIYNIELEESPVRTTIIAKALGVDSCFEGRIYGAIGRIEDYSKEMVIKNILSTHNLKGPQLAVFGDGPVEIRNAKDVGAIAVGVAVDEIQRQGWSERKIKRLTDAGADILIPDFSDTSELSEMIWGT